MKTVSKQQVLIVVSRLVMISIDLSDTAHFDYCQYETKSEEIFFLTKKISRIFSRTKFCPELDFVSDYTPQLYLVCNHLI